MLQWWGEISGKSSVGCFFPSQAEFQGCHREQLHALNADGQLVLVALPHQLPPCFKKILVFLFQASHYRSAFAAVWVQWKGTKSWMSRKSLRGEGGGGGGIWLVWAGGVWGLCTGSELGVEQINSFQIVIPGFGRVLALWLLLVSWKRGGDWQIGRLVAGTGWGKHKWRKF